MTSCSCQRRHVTMKCFTPPKLWAVHIPPAHEPHVTCQWIDCVREWIAVDTRQWGLSEFVVCEGPAAGRLLFEADDGRQPPEETLTGARRGGRRRGAVAGNRPKKRSPYTTRRATWRCSCWRRSQGRVLARPPRRVRRVVHTSSAAPVVGSGWMRRPVASTRTGTSTQRVSGLGNNDVVTQARTQADGGDGQQRLNQLLLFDERAVGLATALQGTAQVTNQVLEHCLANRGLCSIALWTWASVLNRKCGSICACNKASSATACERLASALRRRSLSSSRR